MNGSRRINQRFLKGASVSKVAAVEAEGGSSSAVGSTVRSGSVDISGTNQANLAVEGQALANQKPRTIIGDEPYAGSKGTSDGGMAHPVRGKLIGSTEQLTVAETKYVQEMLDGGRTVEVIPATNLGRSADFKIDGKSYELKTMTNVANQSSDGLSKALSSTIMNARGQSGNVIVDARGQLGMTSEIAERGANRAFGADAKMPDGQKFESVVIITNQGTVYITPKKVSK
ncbi:hypothetical protein HDE71_005488 [Janthinobacterium sp. S3M3]|nr:hypothetical protein [Janthinobacterium sp. S3T4]MBB5616403.1 hypothetical protein [Janthinobacterium sp. S3M3]